MNRFLRFALGVLICVQPATVHAQSVPGQSTPGTGNPIPGQTIRGTGNPIPGQTIPSIPGIGNPIPPAQSLAPTSSICGPGGEFATVTFSHATARAPRRFSTPTLILRLARTAVATTLQSASTYVGATQAESIASRFPARLGQLNRVFFLPDATWLCRF